MKFHHAKGSSGCHILHQRHTRRREDPISRLMIVAVPNGEQQPITPHHLKYPISNHTVPSVLDAIPGDDVRCVEEGANCVAYDQISHCKDHIGLAARGMPKDCLRLFASLEGAAGSAAKVQATSARKGVSILHIPEAEVQLTWGEMAYLLTFRLL